MITEATAKDLEVMESQLGRPMRDVLGIAARCACGNPLVVQTKPRLESGEPFPTFYYLTHPWLTSRLSTLEAGGLMAKMQDRLALEPELQASYQLAHESYLSEREQLLSVEEIVGISAGGMPTRVKCLHALAAHALAKGPGLNPIGDIALTEVGFDPQACICKANAE
jgi:hypothetical protein